MKCNVCACLYLYVAIHAGCGVHACMPQCLHEDSGVPGAVRLSHVRALLPQRVGKERPCAGYIVALTSQAALRACSPRLDPSAAWS